MSADAKSLRRLLVCGALAAITWIVFAQTLQHPFSGNDDQGYVVANPEITPGLKWHGVVAAFTQTHARNWHPLTTLSHMVDCELYGLNPAGHHLTNLLLHTAAVLLLFLVLTEMTGAFWPSALVAAVFAIHPLRAESVAWISERKDVLSAVFFMLTLQAYVRYVREPSRWRYGFVAGYFALGLMAKPMLVTLPLLLLVLDYWPLGRWPNGVGATPGTCRSLGKLILEKAPLFAFSLAGAAATVFAQRSTIGYAGQIPLQLRLGNALVSYVAYARDLLWPTKLAVFYPHPGDQLAAWQTAAAGLLLLTFTLLAFALRRRFPYVITGWLWYLIGLLPVIGVVQVGIQARGDRYTYLPQIGLCIVLAWGAVAACGHWRYRRQGLAIAGAVVVAILTYLGFEQAAFWRNDESLWTHAVAVNPNNAVAHHHVAEILHGKGDLDAEIQHEREAIRASTSHGEVPWQFSVALLHNVLGNALRTKGLVEEASEHYRAAISSRPDYADAHSNLCGSLAAEGHLDEAIAECRTAAALPPEEAGSHRRLAALLLRSHREDEARAHVQRADELELKH